MSLTLTIKQKISESGTVSGTGSEIVLQNTTSSPFVGFELGGDIFQQTYTGKNLLPNKLTSQTTSGITFTVNPDGSIKMVGTASARIEPRIWDKTRDGGAVTLSAGVTYHNTTTRTVYWNSTAGYAAIYAGQNYTPTQDLSINYFYLRVENGEILDTTIYPQIEQGSSATSYEQYVGGIPSPNPDYPQAIQTVTGEQVITITDGGSQSRTYSVDLGEIQLACIGEAQDTIYKNDGRWYIHREIDEIESYNGETIETSYVSTTGELTTGANVFYVADEATDTQITDLNLLSQLNALISANTYDGTTVITSSGALPTIMQVEAVSAEYATKIYTEAELSDPLTIADVEGKSQNTTLDGNVYVDFAYSKKSISVSIFNLSATDYATIRSFYDRQFSTGNFPIISIPELSISNMAVFFEISSREINDKCLHTDKITLKFRETVQP